MIVGKQALSVKSGAARRTVKKRDQMPKKSAYLFQKFDICLILQQMQEV